MIISIDGDTIVDPEAIPRLVRHFADPKVGAVAGNVKVMNRNRWLTRWQALEYITSQNLEKRAFDLLNCIPVVPGAVGAWRTSVLRDHHGFSGDTVAEDTDLTLTIRRDGWKILYDEDAIGRTEVPETVEALDPPALPLDLRHAASRLEASRRRRASRNTARSAGSRFPIFFCFRLFCRWSRRSSICCSCSRSRSGGSAQLRIAPLAATVDARRTWSVR